MLLGAAALALNAAAAFRAMALPRYPARYEQKCGLCHVNPTGGGLRGSYATRQLVPDELASTRRGFAAADSMLPPAWADRVQIGTDFRELFVGSDASAAPPHFFQMQGDLYFDFQLEPRVSLYYDRGISSSYELFGLGYVLPKLYVKAGRFTPSYGWRFDDHTMYVRRELGFEPPANTDVGLEIGASPGPADLQLGVVNGNRGGTLDNDTHLAVIGNATGRTRLGPVGVSGGVSGYHRGGESEDFDSGGLYGYLTWNRLTWLGEGDLFWDHLGGTTTAGLVTSHEVSWLLRQGVDLKLTYDFLDPDRDLTTGARTRWGGGAYAMPAPYVTVEGLLRRTTYERGPASSGPDEWETVLQLHLMY